MNRPPRISFRRSLPWALPALLAAAIPFSAAAEVRYTGSPTMVSAILYDEAVSGFGKRKGITLSIVDVQTGSAKAVERLVKGEVEVAGMGRELRQDELRQGVVPHLLGHDALAVWVNAANPVKGLTTAQLASLLTGEATRWEEVGGKEGPVQPYLQPASELRSTLEVVAERILKGRPAGPRVDTRHVNPRDQMLAVARGKEGLCLASIGLLGTLDPASAAKVKAIPLDGVAPSRESIADGSYPLIRPLILATLGPPQGETKAFVEFMLGPEGQAIVGRNFLPAQRKR